MALQEDEENMNADNIQYVIGEVEETTKEESMLGPLNFDENEEEDEGANDIEVVVNSRTTAVEQDEEEKQPDRKGTVKKPIIKKKFQQVLRISLSQDYKIS
jgi:hypothetical protein